MPGPSPWYRSNAERQRAYRRRKAENEAADRADAELILGYAYALQHALGQARQAGSRDPLLEKIEREDPIETLRALADHFYDQAQVPATARPWLAGPSEVRRTPRRTPQREEGGPSKNR